MSKENVKNIITSIIMTIFFLIIVGIPCYGLDENINFSTKELKFIKTHPVIHIGVDPKFLPFEFIDKNGEYSGIAKDYIEIISEKTGIKFEVVKGLNWTDAYEAAINGDIDVLPAISKTEERTRYFLFSDSYYNFKRVIVVRNATKSTISGIEGLNGKTVAVQKNSSHHSYLSSFPNINLSLYNSVEEALTAVANGSEDIFLGNIATTNYLIRSNGLTNLKFVSFEAEVEQGLHFGVRQDWPEFITILNRVFESISIEEKIAINNKWIDLETEMDYGPIIRTIVTVGLFLGIILIVSFYWIVRLKKEIEMRKNMQIDLENAKSEAERANKFKSNFMARMSHEIRTPLNGIIGMSYLLKKTEVTLTQRIYVDRITHASNNMLTIINDILDFSKIEAGKVELEINSFNLDEVIQNVVNIISYKIEEQEIGFKLYKDTSIPNCFFGDSKRIEQVLLNLLNNGVKFTKSGEVSLDIRLLAKEGNIYYISFTIRDTGIGMSKEQIEKLFIPFTQADASINRRFGGTGLGLSIVKSFLDMMNGEVKVYSTEGEGTNFIVNIPLEIDREKEDELKKYVNGSHFKNLKTLVLEKSGSNMNILGNYLSSFGMECELTTSQATALNFIETANGKFSRPFDLFIVDYETPIEGGFKFIENLSNNKNISKMPKIVMLFPMMREDLFDKLSENFIDAGVEKPIIQSVLFNNILDIFKLQAVAGNRHAEEITINESAVDKEYHVLVVEDNKTNQLIAKTLLEQIGIEVLLADDGKEGVEIYNENIEIIDLILMDLHMPVMGGYEAISEIRKFSKDVPIIVMTADLIMDKSRDSELYGIYNYISKPFDPVNFIKVIKKTVNESESEIIDDKHILNQSIGIRNLGGDENGYKEVLTEYYNENKNVANELNLLIDKKKYFEAIELVHKIKSSSGTIGAKYLYDTSIKLQKALEKEKLDEIYKFKEIFNNTIKRLLDMIKND